MNPSGNFEFETTRAFVDDAQSVLFFARRGEGVVRCYVTRNALTTYFECDEAIDDGSACLQAYDSHRQMIQRVAQHLLADRERVAATEQLKRAATHDALTGLPNRALFMDRLAGSMHQARRDGDRFTVALVDVNDFKEVNDVLGHAIGDEGYLLECADAAMYRAKRGRGPRFRLFGATVTGGSWWPAGHPEPETESLTHQENTRTQMQ